MLNNIIMELSVEMEESEKEKQGIKPDPETTSYTNNLDQTIIIGEMDEGNIFDDFKNIRASDLTQNDKNEDMITLSKDDLKELIDNIKTKHFAEMDAIMLEQASYKRIVQQMLAKFKQLRKEYSQKDLDIIELKKY